MWVGVETHEGWPGSRSGRVTRCSLPEADDSSVFVVGTVLYRNLGSFLALQRWAVLVGRVVRTPSGSKGQARVRGGGG